MRAAIQTAAKRTAAKVLGASRLVEISCESMSPDVAASFATVQLSKTSAHITASMGYSGMDAYAEAAVARGIAEIAITDHVDFVPDTPAFAFTTFEQRERVLNRAHEVFAAAVERYKAELRGRVEASATELFLEMTTEKVDYKQLRINEQYGLSIIHTDGREEDSRSAGDDLLGACGSRARGRAARPPLRRQHGARPSTWWRRCGTSRRPASARSTSCCSWACCITCGTRCSRWT